MLVQNFTEDQAKSLVKNALDQATDFLAKDKPEISEILVKQILRCDPEHLGAMQILGLCKCRMDRYVEAIEIFQTVIDLDPSNADNYNNTALAYAAMEHREKAVECLETALELDPDNPLFYNNLALNQRGMGLMDEALVSMKKAINLYPDSPQFFTNLASLYGEKQDIRNAIANFEKALEIDPDYAGAHVDLAIAYCLDGQWEKGFKEHEWRFDYFAQMIPYLKVYDQAKRWNGNDDLNGKRILVYMEQGFGDQIQFARMLPLLKERGAHVVIHCGDKIEPLLKHFPGVDETTTVDLTKPTAKLPAYDYQIPLLSLPVVLEHYQFDGRPYFACETEWDVKLKEEHPEKLKVGLVWAGSTAHTHDRTRSIPLKLFAPLFNMDNVQVFDLQFEKNSRLYGTGIRPNSPDLKPVNYQEGASELLDNMVNLTTGVSNLMETARIIQGLDLVISCDTAMVHLAGAMGVPCYVLLPYVPDWRWGLENSHTFWYDSVTLFRQSERKNWSEVIENLVKEMHETVLQNQ